MGPKKNSNRDTINAARVQKTAEIEGVSERYVRMVINGERSNEQVLSTYMFIAEGENLLVEIAKQLVPFS